MLFGGIDGELVFDDLWVYHIEANTWKKWDLTCPETCDIPAKRNMHTMVHMQDGFFLFGGSWLNAVNMTVADELND